MIDLDELSRLLEAATPEPWHDGSYAVSCDKRWGHTDDGYGHVYIIGPELPSSSASEAQLDADLAFIVAARNALPELIERARSSEVRIRSALARLYHVRYQRTKDAYVAAGLIVANPCGCPDCQAFDETDAGHEEHEELTSLRELRKVYIDIADALLPNSTGPQDLIAEIRRLRELDVRVDGVTRHGPRFTDRHLESAAKLHNAAVRLAAAYDEYERNGRPSSLIGPLDEARTAYRAAKEGR